MIDLELNQLLVASLNNSEKKLHSESFKYESIFLSSVIPDFANARFLPAILIEDEHAKQFVDRKLTKKQLIKMYNAEQHVIIGKSCVINCLKYNSVEWKKANRTIESIIELGNNISVSEIIQAPTIYPVADSKYKVLTGHRRFFALVYVKGYGAAAQFKLYKTKPLLTKVKQFQENASREDLPQYGKLAAFMNALTEIDALSSARIRVGLKRLTVKEVATYLGVSMGAYDNYNVLTRYSRVIELYESGLSLAFVKTKKVVLEVESEYKSLHEKSVLNASDGKKIGLEIESRLFNKKGQVKTPNLFKVKSIKSAQTIKTLLFSNIMELDMDIDWDNVDWEDHSAVSIIISNVVDYLDNQ
jgi:hypothetical protein